MKVADDAIVYLRRSKESFLTLEFIDSHCQKVAQQMASVVIGSFRAGNKRQEVMGSRGRDSEFERRSKRSTTR